MSTEITETTNTTGTIKPVPMVEENRFSTFVKTRYSSDYAELVRWEIWFNSRGIPAQIHLTNSGYALYREGLIEIDIAKSVDSNDMTTYGHYKK